MTQISDLTSYFTHNFNEDLDNRIYKIFENKYIEYLQYMAKENNWEIINIYKNNFNFSMYLKSNKAPVVISIYDVRKDNFNWYDTVHIKLLKRNMDYKSAVDFEYNTELPKLAKKVNSLTNNKIGVDIDINDIF